MNMTSKSDCIGVTCTRLRHFADTFSQWNSCWKIKTLGHMAENKCGYQMHIFVTSLSSQHAPVWRCFCMVQPLRQPFRPKCTNRILQMHHQNPVVPPESGVHPQNPVCTYSVVWPITSETIRMDNILSNYYHSYWYILRFYAARKKVNTSAACTCQGQKSVLLHNHQICLDNRTLSR